ncbi:MAG: hypothetical protein KKD59_01405 [Acidobacteria bacterium]|nr:hypothetical protein [Acidobacteriota bacterium]
MFKSHLFVLILFSIIVSVLMGCIKFDDFRSIRRYALRFFLMMGGGVFIFSWVMRFI